VCVLKMGSGCSAQLPRIEKKYTIETPNGEQIVMLPAKTTPAKNNTRKPALTVTVSPEKAALSETAPGRIQITPPKAERIEVTPPKASVAVAPPPPAEKPPSWREEARLSPCTVNKENESPVAGPTNEEKEERDRAIAAMKQSTEGVVNLNDVSRRLQEQVNNGATNSADEKPVVPEKPAVPAKSYKSKGVDSLTERQQAATKELRGKLRDLDFEVKEHHNAIRSLCKRKSEDICKNAAVMQSVCNVLKDSLKPGPQRERLEGQLALFGSLEGSVHLESNKGSRWLALARGLHGKLDQLVVEGLTDAASSSGILFHSNARSCFRSPQENYGNPYSNYGNQYGNYSFDEEDASTEDDEPRLSQGFPLAPILNEA